MRIAVIGAGRAGTSLAVRWREAGHTIVAVSGREATAARAATHLPGVPFQAPEVAARAAELVVLAVPDAAIVEVAGAVGPSLPPGAWLAHVAGAAGLEVLGDRACRLAIHPLQTFPDVAPERLVGCAAAVTASDEEGLVLGERLARDVGAVPFRLRDEDRPLYHAAAVFASNHVVAVSAIAERLFAAAGVPDPPAAMAPLQRATLDNVEALGAAAALTGPAVRGDVGSIVANLAAIAATAPDLVAVYVVLCRAMVDLAARSGRLGAARADAVEEALAPWT